MPSGPPPRPSDTRWGLRTMAFLALAAGCIVVDNVLRADGGNDYVLLTFAGTVIGLVGAAVCSVRGLRSWKGFKL